MAKTHGKPVSTRAQRRAEARARAKARARRVPLRRRIPKPLRSRWFRALVLLAVAGAAANAWWQGTRLEPLPDEPAAVPSTITSYRVVYALTDTAEQGKTLRNTEVVEVRRPYASRIETHEGAPPGTEMLSGSVTNEHYFWNMQKGGEVQFGIRRQPGTAHRDTSYTVLRDAAREGLVRREGTDEVLGHPCELFAFKEPRPQPLEPPTRDDSVTACVTTDGVSLREVWRLDGRVVVTREAVEFEIDADVGDERFLIGTEPDPELEANVLIAQTQAVTEDQDPEFPVFDPRLPAGFERTRSAMHFESGGGQAPPRNTYFVSYVRGPGEVVIVDQGVYMSASPPWSGTEGSELRVHREWTSILLYTPDHVEVRMWRPEGDDPELPQTRFLRVQAPGRDLAVWFAKTAVA